MRKPAENWKIKEMTERHLNTPLFSLLSFDFREKFGIPMNGYSSKSHTTRWYRRWNNQREKYLSAERHIMRTLKLPFSAREHLEELLLSDGKVHTPHDNLCDVEVPSGRAVANRGGKFVRLIIPDYAGEDEVKGYITRNWRSNIRKHFGSPKAPKVRSTKNRARDEEIYFLWLRSRKSLELLGMHKKDTKAGFIARYITNKGHRVSADNVRRIASAQRQIFVPDI